MAALEALLRHIETADIITKERACKALALVAEKGHPVHLSKVRRLTLHRSRDVRILAIKTLCVLCDAGNMQHGAVPLLLICLQGDVDQLVRIEALHALSTW